MRFRRYRNVIVIGLVAAVACGPVNNNARVVVDYKQLANFPDYRLAPDSADSHGAGDGMFILYKVTQIHNTGSAAKAFVFDVNKISTVTPDKTSNETVTDANTLLVGQNLTTVNVAAGQTQNVNRCFIKQALTSTPTSLVSAQVGLLYSETTDQPISMNNLAPNGAVAAVGNALPNTLQSLCSSN
jgi:hypothetical protein